jgi:hypothetical protein
LVRQHHQSSKENQEKTLKNKAVILPTVRSKSVTHSNDEHFKTKTVGPLSCPRDPLRVPLQSHLPFTTNAHHGRKICFDENDSSSSANTNVTSKTKGAGNFTKHRSLSDLEGSKFNRMTPAYAYRNPKTNLLEIRTKPPIGETEVIDQPLPIAVNAGGVGLYTGSDFALGGLNSMSHNRHETNWGAMNPVIEFPWNHGENTFSGEKQKRSEDGDIDSDRCKMEPRYSSESTDIEAGLLDVDVAVRDGLNESKDETFHVNPWKEWEKYLKNVKPIEFTFSQESVCVRWHFCLRGARLCLTGFGCVKQG